MWSRAETSTRPWGRWGKATRKGEWTSSRTCKPRTKGLASHAWVLKTINCDQFRPPKKLLSLSDRMSECYGYEWHFKKQNQSKKSKPPPRASIYLTGLYVSSRQSCWKAQLPHNRSEQTCQDIKEDEVVTLCMNTISAVCIWFVFVYGHKSCEYRAHGHKT